MAKVIRMGKPRGDTAPPLAKYGDVLSVADVCELTGWCARVVREYCGSGKIPAVKIGSRWVIPKKRLIEALRLGAA
ncbi:helix-turn-helix domain-containing protein [Adlercreutzia caecimuris]|uniref:helix-turn-helix domain-containing protein n=1 Tax=Adlercreutzia caecimuris TaxID=671266 RepID=UPI00272B5DEA|nr:helix-turn-helix domain-containing protein [Adlercreutzia caecimuris]